MKRIITSYRMTKTVQNPQGEALDVQVSYKWDTADNQHRPTIKHEIVDSAIERLVHRVCQGLTLCGPIKICVEHCNSQRGQGPLTEMRCVKVYVDGHGPSMVIAY